MKRQLPLYLIVSTLLFTGAGCATDDYARQIIVQNAGPGRVWLALKGTGEQLIKEGKIDMHREVARPDGTVIDVWVIKGRPTTQLTRVIGTVLILHGVTESKVMFPYFGIGQRLSKMGYDVVLPDLRAHGRSTGKYVTYGALEKYDIKAVIDQLVKEGMIHTPIYAFGNNLGGSVAIQYAAIDPRCQGVMAVVPYKDMASIGLAQLKIIAPMMSSQDYQEVLQRAGEMGEFDPAQASAVNAAKQLTCPLLLVHGVLDLSVPREHSKAIYEAAAGPKKFVEPSFEAIALPAILEDWIVSQLNALARKGLQ